MRTIIQVAHVCTICRHLHVQRMLKRLVTAMAKVLDTAKTLIMASVRWRATQEILHGARAFLCTIDASAKMVSELQALQVLLAWVWVCD